MCLPEKGKGEDREKDSGYIVYVIRLYVKTKIEINICSLNGLNAEHGAQKLIHTFDAIGMGRHIEANK